MKVEDCTRELALQMQAGVVEAKRRTFGPLTFSRVEYPNGVGASIQLTIGDYCIQLSSTRSFRDEFTA